MFFLLTLAGEGELSEAVRLLVLVVLAAATAGHVEEAAALVPALAHRLATLVAAGVAAARLLVAGGALDAVDATRAAHAASRRARRVEVGRRRDRRHVLGEPRLAPAR